MKIIRVMISCSFFLIANSVLAEEPVYIPDTNLKSAIENKLGIENPTPTHMLDLTSLVIINSEFFPDFNTTGVTDLTGLEYATNLHTFKLRVNLVSNLSPLSGLTSLQTLHLSRNKITNISPLSGLINLKDLDLHGNRNIISMSPISGLSNLQTLIIRQTNTSNISCLSGLTNLRVLQISSNNISNISALSRLVNLQQLVMSYNNISSLSGISSLINLRTLEASSNKISNIYSLSKLSALQTLKLQYNQISDISKILDLKNLNTLNLKINPLDNDAYANNLQTIKENNPHIGLMYTPNPRPATCVSASKGIYQDKISITWDEVCNGPQYTSYYRLSRSLSRDGDKTLISEWQTSTSFDDLTAELGQKYFYWIQTAVLSQGTNAGNYSEFDTGWRYPYSAAFYVDNNAPEDPGPIDPMISDPNEDGTYERPFDTIQEAINKALDGDIIIVKEGTYRETIVFMGNNITVTSFDPNKPNTISSYPIINANNHGTAVSFIYGEDAKCILKGFVITSGQNDFAGAIYSQGSSPTIANCLIVGNRSFGPHGAAIYCQDSKIQIINCTVSDNENGEYGAGIYFVESNAILKNSIVSDNIPGDISYSDSDTSMVEFTFIGELTDTYPLFISPGYWDNNNLWIEGDYHLLSESPCIDAGDPNSPVGPEPEPNNNLINQGAYGGTPQASVSLIP